MAELLCSSAAVAAAGNSLASSAEKECSAAPDTKVSSVDTRATQHSERLGAGRTDYVEEDSCGSLCVEQRQNRNCKNHRRLCA